MQFMASITFDPAHHPEVEQRVPAEQVRVRELQHQGVLESLYIPVGAGAPSKLWAVFTGDSPAEIQRALESLPLYPYMQVELTPLRQVEARA
jgi:muconolactone delta-isomerase